VAANSQHTKLAKSLPLLCEAREGKMVARATGNPYPLVLVEWVDSVVGTTGWGFLANAKASLTVCRSVGWLVRDDAKCKLLVAHVSEANEGVDAQGCGDVAIPSAAVVRITPLVEGQRRRSHTPSNKRGFRAS
jgi:hypothetical protein